MANGFTVGGKLGTEKKPLTFLNKIPTVLHYFEKDLSLPPIVCRRFHVLFTLFVCLCIFSGVVFFALSSSCVLCTLSSLNDKLYYKVAMYIKLVNRSDDRH
jgi:hypothetical protein